MLRTKRDVDRHVRELLSKIKCDSERKSKGFTIARLYQHINEYESARRYISEFIYFRPRSPEAHKLLGQVYEELNQKQKAIISYKTSYEIAPDSDCQRDLILKICELYAESECENTAALCWAADEGVRLFPHHNSVVKLREQFMMNKSSKSNVDLEKLYLHEIKANPLSLTLYIKLLKLYLDWSREDKCKLEAAYNYVVKIEKRRPFPHSVEWYQNVFATIEAYENWKKPHRDKKFEELVLSILDRYIFLSIVSSNGPALTAVCSMTEAVKRLQKFDTRLFVSLKTIGRDSACGQHMINQYYFHLATILFLLNDKEAIYNFENFVGLLLMNAINPTENKKIPSNSSDLELIKCFWYHYGCYRVSQSGYLLKQFSANNGGEAKYLDKIKEIASTENGKKTLSDLIFGASYGASFLMQDDSFCSNLHYISDQLQLRCDQDVSISCSKDLQELVWLFMQYDSKSTGLVSKLGHSFFNFNIFRGIPFSSNLNTNAPESLSHLDVIAFIAATVYCQQANNPNFKEGLLKPSALCLHLHTSEQVEWWNAASMLCNNSINKRINRLRSVLQTGIEGIRHLSQNVLPLPLTLHLARYFTACAATGRKESNSLSEIEALENRAEHYWNKVLNQFKKAGNISLGWTAKSRLFELPRTEITESERSELEEEGQLFLANQLENKGMRQDALQMLGSLKSSRASFNRAMLYKKSAKELIGSQNVNRLSMDVRSEYISFLIQARDTLYLTLDRLKMPDADDSLSLNKELSEELASVENSLATASYDDHDTLTVEPLNISSNDFQPALELTNGTVSAFIPQNVSSSTPFRPGNASTARVVRQEARPSPERLDCQIRHLNDVQSNTIKNLEEQNQSLREQNSNLLQTCKTMADEYKTQINFYREMMSHKTEGLGGVGPIVDMVTEIRNELRGLKISFKGQSDDITDSKNDLKGLKYDMRGLSNQVTEMKRIKPEPLQIPLPIPTVSAIGSESMNLASPMQSVYNNYMGFYGQQPVANPLVAPSALFQPPFLPPSTMSEPTYLPSSPSVLKNEASVSPYGSPYHVSAAQGLVTISSCMPSLRVSGMSSNLAINSPPNSFQIPLITSAALSMQLESVTKDSSASTFSTVGLLSNVPAPIYSAVVTSPDRSASQGILAASLKITPTSAGRNASITGGFPGLNLSNNHNSPILAANLSGNAISYNDHYVDDGHDPCPDYKPVIPLPATVDVITGEEDEVVFFEEKAKLFRFVDKEWKERGIGPMKILHNKTQRTARVLMRRDQILKICCNHLIKSSYDLGSMKDNEKAWVWGAQDFSEEELKLEKFCCRFKTVEIAKAFKVAFDKGKEIALESSERNPMPIKDSKLAAAITGQTSKGKSLSEMFKPAEGSWSCDSCYVVNEAKSQKCASCSTPNPNAPQDSSDNNKESEDKKKDSFKFGLFGASTAQPTASLSFGTSTTSQSSSGFSFGTGTNLPAFSNTSVTPATTESLFGIKSSSVSVTPVTTESLFGNRSSSVSITPVTTESLFGNISSSVSITPVTTQLSSLFGNSSITITPVKPETPSLFGTNTTPASSSSDKFSLKGFTFSSKPSLIVSDSEQQEAVSSTEPEKTEPKKESVFSNFSFKSPGNTTDSTPGFGGFNLPEIKTSNTGGIFSGDKVGPTLTFGSLASSDKPDASIFKTTKDESAFKQKTVFGTKSSDKSVGEDGANVSRDEVEEYEPQVDFKPVIPLPDLIDVKTGEEDEEKLFCNRGKLYRFDGNTKEWKERGVGDMKILKNKNSNKARVLMRRDQTHKLCANHFISSEMSLTSMANSDTAWVWGANDYADEEVRTERFAIKFKTQNFAKDFKRVFEECKELEPVETSPVKAKTPEISSSLADQFKPAAGSWECDACLVMNSPDCNPCAACQTPKPGTEVSCKTGSSSSIFSSKPFAFGVTSGASGFSFGTGSATSATKTTAVTTTPSASFSFGVASSVPTSNKSVTFGVTDYSTKSATGSFLTAFQPVVTGAEQVTPTKNGLDSQAADNFAFGSPVKYEFSFKPSDAKSPRSRDVSVCESEDGLVDEDEEDSIYFEPVIPMPDKIDVVTGEEQEEVLFTHRSKLFRLTRGEYKERGLGDVKILRHYNTRKIRLLMRREQIHKICLNHYVNEHLEFHVKDDKSFYWVTTDYSENEPSKETFAIRFKTPEIAQSFITALQTAQSEIGKEGNSNKSENVNSNVWVSKPLFGASSAASKDKSLNESQNEEEQHDPHFEPVIPLPELVEVKTGEEGWTNLFSHRAKTYKYDVPTKQWKERGIGDFKIQHEPKLMKYRFLQRREQVYKLSCNHYLTSSITVDPMTGSENAWCWLATDFSEKPEGELLKLAVRFKTKDLATQFKTTFDECMEKILNMPAQPASSDFVVMSASSLAREESEARYSPFVDKYSDDYDDDTDDEEPSTMLTDCCTLYHFIDDKWQKMGLGEIRIFYDDEAYLARVVVNDVTEDDEKMTDHVISIQSTFHKEDLFTISWSGMDDTNSLVKLKATFDNEESAENFLDTLHKGKDLALNAGIDGLSIKEVPSSNFYYGQLEDVGSSLSSCDPNLTKTLLELIKDQEK